MADSQSSSTTPVTKMNKADFKKLADKLENSTFHPIKIDRLTNENWLDWSFCMSSKLRIARLWTMVNTEFEDDVRQMSEYTTLNQMTIDQIILNVDITIRQDLYRIVCAREMWNKLRDRFEGDDDQKCMRTFRILVDLIQSKTQDLSKCVTEFKRFHDSLSKLFPTLEMRPFVGLLYSLLPNEFAYLPAVFRTQTDLDVHKVISFLEREQQLKFEKEKKPGNPPYKRPVSDTITSYKLDTENADKRELKQKCEFCGKSGHQTRKCFKLRDFKRMQQLAQSADPDFDSQGSSSTTHLKAVTVGLPKTHVLSVRTSSTRDSINGLSAPGIDGH